MTGSTPSIADTTPANTTPPGTTRLILARLAVGTLVFICAEVLSGSVFPMGVWHPWTLLVNYWLYFAHFFFFTTLAVRTGRTSLPSLYLWGVLFGLYESWITKVIWSGYSGDGKLVIGSIGPFGYSEISMAFFFHPVLAFLVPLTLTCLFCPAVRGLFPDLAWFTGDHKKARWIRAYLVVGFAPAMAVNSGGPINLALNSAIALMALVLLLKLGRPVLTAPKAAAIVVFGRWGFALLCCYLVLLYGVTYFHLRPEALPPWPAQALTLVFYGVVMVGLWRHRHVAPTSEAVGVVRSEERKRTIRLFVVVFAVAFVLSILAGTPIVAIPAALNFIVWTPLGFGLTAWALCKGRRGITDSTDATRLPDGLGRS